MTKSELRRLLRAAIQDDDLEMASICELALDGDEDAAEEVAKRAAVRERARLDGAA
jgi:hypothetical protein